MDIQKIYKQTKEHRRKISEANKGKTGEIDTITEKLRRKKISQTMKQKFLNNPSEFDRIRKSAIERKNKLGYVNSPEARKKFSKSLSKMWKEGRATESQRQTLFKKGNDAKRNTNQIFTDGHEVPLKTREAVKKSRAKQIFPKVDSSIEVKIQNFLKQLGIEFFTHQYMNIKHGYQCDILIPSKNLVIECFGNYWHKYPYGTEIDIQRCNELREKGFRVFVFWEKEIKVMELNDFRNKIK